MPPRRAGRGKGPMRGRGWIPIENSPPHSLQDSNPFVPQYDPTQVQQSPTGGAGTLSDPYQLSSDPSSLLGTPHHTPLRDEYGEWFSQYHFTQTPETGDGSQPAAAISEPSPCQHPQMKVSHGQKLKFTFSSVVPAARDGQGVQFSEPVSEGNVDPTVSSEEESEDDDEDPMHVEPGLTPLHIPSFHHESLHPDQPQNIPTVDPYLCPWQKDFRSGRMEVTPPPPFQYNQNYDFGYSNYPSLHYDYTQYNPFPSPTPYPPTSNPNDLMYSHGVSHQYGNPFSHPSTPPAPKLSPAKAPVSREYFDHTMHRVVDIVKKAEKKEKKTSKLLKKVSAVFGKGKGKKIDDSDSD